VRWKNIGINIQHAIGCGISGEVMSRIFDPYFTTKEVGKGTRMGLMIMVHGIVKSYGGSIRCESRVGEGTTFYVTLPATRDEEREKNEEGGQLPPRRRAHPPRR
jgi:signal transduction histidine kinase